jgi:protein KTI12
MPLLVICGKPGSGKTTRANEIVQFYKSKNENLEVKLINAETFNVHKEKMFESFNKEKEIRSFFKSNVNKLLTKDNLVIIDSLNYIKGYRYELFCLSRTAKSTHCVLYCDNDLESCKEYNASQTDPQYKFSDELLVDLYNRMEVPNSNNRWDNPLYIIWPHEELPMDAIDSTLFKDKKKMKDPVSTKLQLKLDQNYAYKVDQKLNEVIKTVNKELMQNKQFLKQKFVVIVKGKQKYSISGKIGLTGLKKVKNDFVEMNKINPIFDLVKLEEAFLYFLQSRN